MLEESDVVALGEGEEPRVDPKQQVVLVVLLNEVGNQLLRHYF